MAKPTVGVDLGGTKVLAAVVDGSDVGESIKRPTPTDGPEAVVAAIAEMVEELGGAHRLGVGTPGYVDDDGVVGGVPNLQGWDPPVPLRAMLREATGVSHLGVDNDVNAAALGEVAHGAAEGHHDVLCVFMGTGVGGGLVLSGELRRGPRGVAGEIGHLVVRHGGRACACGGNGHVEAYAGRAGMEAEARRRHAAGEETALVDIAGDDRMKSSVFDKALKKGDRVAEELMEEAVVAVGTAIASAVMLVDVDLVVVGGGVADKLGPELVARVGAESSGLLGEALAVPVVPAALGDDAGVVGAALLGERA